MTSYLYVDGEYEIRREIKRSLFIATVKGELDADVAEEFVKSVKKRYPDATHNCYAYISDELGNAARSSDDGEPSGTAGQPILDVLKKQNLKKTAIVVTRYFGGIKLGASGLVGAYSGAAAEALKAARIFEKHSCEQLIVHCDYADLPAIDKILRKGDAKAENIDYASDLKVCVYVKQSEADGFVASVREATAGRAQISKTGVYAFKKL